MKETCFVARSWACFARWAREQLRPAFQVFITYPVESMVTGVIGDGL